MNGPVRREREQQPNPEAAESATPEALRFPPRERPTTVRRPDRDAPFDLAGEDASAERADEERAADRTAREVAREAEERAKAIREARAALAGQGPSPDLASVVWDAHEAIAHARETEGDPDRPDYVPIAHASRGRAVGDIVQHEPLGVYVAPYNLPEHADNPAVRPVDLLRRVTLTVASVLFLVLSVSTPGGRGLAAAFGQDAAALSPFGPAWLAWPFAALGLTASAVHAWFPGQASARRQRASGWTALVTAAAGAAWCGAAGAGQTWLALAAALLMLASAWRGVAQLNLLTARTRTERWLTDAPLEFALGWAAFAVAWSGSAAVTEAGWRLGPAQPWAVVTLLLVMIPVCMVGMSERGRVVPGLGFAWGAAWLLVARLVGGHTDAVLMLVAGAGAALVLLMALARRHEIGHTERVMAHRRGEN